MIDPNELNFQLEDAQESCDHTDSDDYTCLDCGKELTEDRMAQAYDQYKASKYED